VEAGRSDVTAVILFIRELGPIPPRFALTFSKMTRLCAAHSLPFQWRVRRLGSEMTNCMASDCSKFLCSNTMQRGFFNRIDKDTLSKDTEHFVHD
jgi:hypothetical protein